MKKLTIGFVRRGYSASGGAEAYLKRLARGVTEAGHTSRLFTASEWPPNEWPFGAVTRVRGDFADNALTEARRSGCGVVMSLERIRACDVYRAGDGVHRAWLEQREKFSNGLQSFLRRFNGKNRVALELDNSLFGGRGARRVIANSKMVRDEIVRFYDYPSGQIDVVYNGVPVKFFRKAPSERRGTEITVAFVGSGWERKGLRFAIEAVEKMKMKLLVAGRGDERRFRSSAVEFLGVVSDARAVYSAADIFLLPTIYDPFSNACLEALASGLPVITTSNNGFSEIIEHEINGSIVDDPSDISELGRALEFWSDERRREKARAKNLELAERFDISRNVVRTLEILLQADAPAASTLGKIAKT